MAATRVEVRHGESDSDSDDYIGDDDYSLSSAAELDADEQDTAKSANTTAADDSGICGITDVIDKILNKSVSRKNSKILGQTITDQQIITKKKLKEKENGSPKKDRKSKGKDLSSDESDDDGRKKRLAKRGDWDNLGRKKPSVLDKDREKSLQKIATRGVIQLFNAVRQQQNLVADKLSEAGSSIRKRDKVVGSVTKKHFLDLLDHTQAKSADGRGNKKAKIQEEDTQEAKWSILRDDYMMGARMKDWDKDSEDDDM